MPSVKKDNKNKANNEYMQLALTIFVEITGWIAFPVIGALFLGRWLDEKQGTAPVYFLSITAVAFILSSIGIGMTGVKYMKRIEKEDLSAKALAQGEALKKKNDNESRDK